MDGLLKYARGAAILVFMLSRFVEPGAGNGAAAETRMSAPVVVIAQACDEDQGNGTGMSAGVMRATCTEIEGGI